MVDDRAPSCKLKLGQVAFSHPSSARSSLTPEFGAFEMPFIVQDRNHMRRIQAGLGDVFQEVALGEGCRIIGCFESDCCHITNSILPIDTPEDLPGVKLRAPNGEWRIKTFHRHGANLTPKRHMTNNGAAYLCAPDAEASESA